MVLEVPLGEVVKEISQRNGATTREILSVTNNGGFQPSLDRFDKQVFSVDTSMYKVVRSGDIAYNPTRIGVGSVALLEGKESGAISPMYVVLRCNERILPGFLHRFLKSQIGQKHIAGRSVNSVRPQLRFRDLEEISIGLPSIEEQRRLLGLFGQIDDIQADRTRSDALTAEVARSLHRRMFSADRAMREEWPEVRLTDYCRRLTVGHVGSMTSHYVDHGVPFLRGQNVKRGRLDLSEVQHVNENFAAKLSKSELRPGDVVSVRTGKPGTSAVVPDNLPFANCADLIVLSPEPALNPHFLAETLNQRLGDQLELQHSVGAAQKHFNIGEARKIVLRLPPLHMQADFARRVMALDELRESQAESAASITDARVAIEHRAFAPETHVAL